MGWDRTWEPRQICRGISEAAWGRGVARDVAHLHNFLDTHDTNTRVPFAWTTLGVWRTMQNSEASNTNMIALALLSQVAHQAA